MSFDLTSGSEVVLSPDNEDESELQQQNRDLQNSNSSLTKQLNTLTKQYNDMMEVVQNMEKIKKDLANRTAELRKANAEKEDYAHRLEISLQVNQELKDQLEKMKHQNEDVPSFRQILENGKRDLNKHSAELSEQVQSLSEKLNKSQAENEKYSNQIAGLLEAAGHYFSNQFSDPKVLVAFLSAQICSETEAKQNAKESSNKIKSLTQEIQKLNKTIQRLSKENDEARAKIIQLDSDNSLIKSKAENKISTAEMKINELQKAIQRNDFQNKQTITAQQDTIASLEASIQRLKNKLDQKSHRSSLDSACSSSDKSDSSQSEEYQQKLHQLGNDIGDKDHTIFSLQQQNESLIDTIKASQNTQAQLKEKIDILQNEKDQLLNSNDDLKRYISALELKNTSLRDKLHSTETQLQAAQTSFKQAQNASDNSKANETRGKNANEYFIDMIEKQKNEISGLTEERIKMISILQKQSNLLIANENILAEQKEKINNLQNQLIDQDVEAQRFQDDIPLTSWFIPEFPKELTQVLIEIAKDSNLSIPIKLKRVLTAIYKFFETKVQEFSRKVDQSSEEQKSIQNILEYIEEKISNIVESPISFQTQKLADDAINRLYNLKNSKIELENNQAKLSNLLQEICRRTNCSNSQSLLKTLENLFDKLSKVNNALKTEKAKHKKMKKAIKNAMSYQEKQFNDLANEKGKLEQKIINLNSENSNLVQHETELESLNSQLRNEIAKLKREHADAMDSADDRKEEELEKLRQEINLEKESYKQQLQELQQAKCESERHADLLAHEIEQWKQTIAVMKDGKAEAEKQLLEVQEELENKEKSIREKAEKERIEIKNQFQGAIKALKEKNDELRNLVEKATISLNNAEEEKKQLQDEKNALETSLDQIKHRQHIMSQEMTREKQLIDTKVRAAKLSEQLEYEKKLGNINESHENEKRKLFNSIASYFKDKIDPRRPLNQESLMKIIADTKEELVQFRKDDFASRRLLGLTSKESLPEALEQLLLCLYKE